ncbi:glycosyltransferase [Arthrobacter sp. LAPM80]|uniref:glycosyltransferase n=1 Tax=Arthrobacter sp. LAPM80 TaxID=3141788 RepID=UPI00398A9E96
MRIDHVLLTRFNLPTPGVESLVRAQEGWLIDRMALFERYCFRSVEQQSEQGFQWIIYLDTQSPQWLRDRIGELGSGGLFTAIYRDEVPQDVLIADIRRVSGAAGDVLLTTNLDNDDGLAVDFVHRVQSAVKDQRRVALYLGNGLIQQGGRLYLRRDPKNAFCSVSDSWQDPSTCWVDWHTKLGELMPVVEILGSPGWLQMIHTGNVSNRVRGYRVAPGRYKEIFKVGLDEVGEPAALKLLLDGCVLAPGRAARDALRRAGKALILGVAGKSGLDAFKSFIAGDASTRAH